MWDGPSDHGLNFWTPVKPAVLDHLVLLSLELEFSEKNC